MTIVREHDRVKIFDRQPCFMQSREHLAPLPVHFANLRRGSSASKRHNFLALIAPKPPLACHNHTKDAKFWRIKTANAWIFTPALPNPVVISAKIPEYFLQRQKSVPTSS